MPAPVDFVAHETARTVIDDIVTGLAQGRRGVAVIVGEAGLGKSTLLARAATLARGSEVDLIEARGAAGDGDRPLAPLIDSLELPATSDPDRRLVEAPLGDPAMLLVQRVVDVLDQRAQERPTLLLIDDAHWLDAATVLLVQHLAARPTELPLAMIVAAREPTPDSPLEQMLGELDAALLSLGRVGDEGISAIAAIHLGRSIGPGLATALRGAEGNPMLAVAMLDSLLHEGAITLDDEQADLLVPSLTTTDDVLEHQLAGIDADTIGVLQFAAAIGGPLRFDVLARVLRRSALDVARTLGPAIDAGVLVDDDGEVVFRHDLHREAALASMSEQQRRSAHAKIADALAELGAPVLAVAEHYAVGATRGDRPAARHLAAAAADVVGAAPALALRLCETARALSLSVDDDLGLGVTRVRALAGIGRTDDAEALAADLLARDPGDDLEARLRRELALTAFITGRPAEASQQMARVVELARDPRQRATALAERAWASLMALDATSARVDAGEAIRLGTPIGAVDAVVMARAVRCWLDLWAADYAAATTDADALQQTLAQAAPGPWQSVQPWLAIAAVRLDLDDEEAARAAAEAGRRLATDTGSGWAVAVHDALLADLRFRTRDLEEAAAAARSAITGTALVDGMGVELWARATLARTMIELGDLDGADTELTAAEIALDDGRAQLGLDRFLLARALVHEARGEVTAAHATYCGAWDLMSAIGIRYVLPSLAPGLLRTAARLPSDAVDPVVIGSVLATLDEITSAGAPPSQQRYRAEARAWIDPARVEPRRAEAFRLDPEVGDRLGVQKAPDPTTMTTGDDLLAGLTPAERRVAGLVATGLTNTQIAAHLMVSRRTVDSHVLAAYRKLGVASRVALTRAILSEVAS